MEISSVYNFHQNIFIQKFLNTKAHSSLLRASWHEMK